MLEDKNWVADKLRAHIGHKIAVVTNGKGNTAENICVKCEDCGEVLISGADCNGTVSEATADAKKVYTRGTRELTEKDFHFDWDAPDYDGEGSVSFYMTMDGDCDKIFGTNVETSANDDYVNVYCTLSSDLSSVEDDIYLIHADGDVEEYYKLSDDEKVVIQRKAMEWMISDLQERITRLREPPTPVDSAPLFMKLSAENMLDDFSDFFDFCNTLKTAYYQCLYISRNRCKDMSGIERDEIRGYQHWIGTSFAASEKKAYSFEELFQKSHDILNEYFNNEKLQTIIKDISRACESLDRSFFNFAGFTKYENELKLPARVEELFNAYANQLAEKSPNVVRMDEKPQEGYWGIAYYDLSDIMLVFRSEDAACSFMHKSGVDVSQFLHFSGNGWHGC